MTIFINQNFEGTGFDNGETWITYGGDTGAANPDYTTNPLLGSQSLYMKDDNNEGTYAVNIYSDGTGYNAEYGFFRIKFLDFAPADSDKEVLQTYKTASGSPQEVHEAIYHAVNWAGNAAILQLKAGATVVDEGSFTISLNTVYYVWFYFSRDSSNRSSGWVKISSEQSIPATNDLEWTNRSVGYSYRGTGAIGFTTEHGIGYSYVVDQVIVSDSAIGNDPFGGASSTSHFRLRFLIDATGDPPSGAYQLEYRRKADGGSFGDWYKVIPE